MDVYTEKQIEVLLKKIGIEVVAETHNDFLCFCPYHGNRHTPSFTVSKHHGAFLCQNAACAEAGTLVELVRSLTRKGEFEIARMILKARNETHVPAYEQVQKILAEPEGLPEFPQATLDAAYNSFWETPSAQEYMHDRGFEDETLEHFKIGYSPLRDLIMVPMHDYKGNPIGVIGRSPSHVDKVFKNSRGLPTSKTLWNLHRAKAHETLIIVEASFDAMRVHQAGYPNVAACLGGNFNAYHAQLVDRYFDTVVIMTDFDDAEKHRYNNCRVCRKAGLEACAGHNPGRRLGHTIAGMLPNKTIEWAAWDYKIVYPNGAKDAGDMTDEEIRRVIKDAVPHYEYESWGIAS
jgi:DNA primase